MFPTCMSGRNGFGAILVGFGAILVGFEVILGVLGDFGGYGKRDPVSGSLSVRRLFGLIRFFLLFCKLSFISYFTR